MASKSPPIAQYEGDEACIICTFICCEAVLAPPDTSCDHGSPFSCACCCEEALCVRFSDVVKQCNNLIPLAIAHYLLLGIGLFAGRAGRLRRECSHQEGARKRQLHTYSSNIL